MSELTVVDTFDHVGLPLPHRTTESKSRKQRELEKILGSVIEFNQLLSDTVPIKVEDYKL